MIRTGITTTSFEPRRVLEAAALLGALAALGALLLAGWRAGAGAALGCATGSLAFSWLDRSLRADAVREGRLALVLGSVGRLGLWAAVAILVSVAWGASGGGGFLAGMVAVKTAVVIEGLRARGG